MAEIVLGIGLVVLALIVGYLSYRDERRRMGR